jgi:opacity protein-like surface antigen
MKMTVLVCCLFVFIIPAAAQSDKGVEVFGGYSYSRIDDDFFNEGLNANGAEGAVTFFLTKRFGISADTDVHWTQDLNIQGTPPFAVYQDIHRTRYQVLGGPHFRFVNSTRATPFVHALVGIAHTRLRNQVTGSAIPDDIRWSRTEPAIALGGGIDIRASKRVSIRAFQFDYNPEFVRSKTFPQGTVPGITLNHFRISAGVVFN